MNTTHGISWFKKQTVYAWIRERFKLVLLLGTALLALQTHAVNFTPLPPYLSEIKGAPMVMLNLSRDHQLFYKAYNEYSDLDGDGVVETQYKHAYKYYGYFDNQRCYQYSTTDNRFFPTRQVASDGYCNYTGGSSEWNGNFMNWATMTRMDVVRRILYGGFRSTDASIVSGASLTVLERAHLPTDAHAFAKYYAGADINKLTPFAKAEITLCNASFNSRGGRKLFLVECQRTLAMLLERNQNRFQRKQFSADWPERGEFQSIPCKQGIGHRIRSRQLYRPGRSL